MVRVGITCTKHRLIWTLEKSFRDEGFSLNSYSQLFETWRNELHVRLISCYYTRSSSKQDSDNLPKLTTKAACRFLGRLCLPMSHSYLCVLVPAFWRWGQGIRDHTHEHTHTDKMKHKHDILYGNQCISLYFNRQTLEGSFITNLLGKEPKTQP